MFIVWPVLSYSWEAKKSKKHLMNNFAITTVNVNFANCMKILVYIQIQYLKHKTICNFSSSLIMYVCTSFLYFTCINVHKILLP